MASWRIRFHDKWPHLSTLYTSTHNLDEAGKNPDPLMGIDNIFDPNEPYGAYRYCVQPRSEMSIEEPSYTRGVYKDDESRSRSSDYVIGGGFKRGSACRIILCIFLVMSFIGVVLAAITLAVILSQHNVTRRWPSPMEFDSEMTLNGANFTPKLRDNTSEEFKALEKSFCSALHELFLADDSPIKSEWSGCEVLEFSNGSVVARFRIFVRPRDKAVTEGMGSMEEQLITYLSKKLRDDGPWKTLKINLDSIKDFVKVDNTGWMKVTSSIDITTPTSGTTTTTTSTTTKEIVNTSPNVLITSEGMVNTHSITRSTDTDASTQELVLTQRTMDVSMKSVTTVGVRTEALGVSSTSITATVTGDFVDKFSTIATERQTAQASHDVSTAGRATSAVFVKGLPKVISTGTVLDMTDATTKRSKTFTTERMSTELDITLSTTPIPIPSIVSADARTFVSTLTTPIPKADSAEQSTIKTLSEGTSKLVTARTEDTITSLGETVTTEGTMSFTNISMQQEITTSNLLNTSSDSFENATEISYTLDLINISTPVALVSNAEPIGISTTAFTDVVSTLSTDLGLLSVKENMTTSSTEKSLNVEDRTLPLKTNLSSTALPTGFVALTKDSTLDTSAHSAVFLTTISPEVSSITDFESNISTITEIVTTFQSNGMTDSTIVPVNTSTITVSSELPSVIDGRTVSPDVAVSTYTSLNVSEAINFETFTAVNATYSEIEFTTLASNVFTEATNTSTDMPSVPLEVSTNTTHFDTFSNVSDLIRTNASLELSTMVGQITNFVGTTISSNITATTELDITSPSVDNSTNEMQAESSKMTMSTESVQVSSVAEVIVTKSTQLKETLSQQPDNVTLGMDQKPTAIHRNETSYKPEINVTLAALSSTETVLEDSTTAETVASSTHSLDIKPTYSAETDAVKIEITTSEIAITMKLSPTTSTIHTITTSEVIQKTNEPEVDRPTITSTAEYNYTSFGGNVSSDQIYNETTDSSLAGKEIVSNISAETTDQNVTVPQVQPTTNIMATSTVSHLSRQTTQITTTETIDSVFGTSHTFTNQGIVDGISSSHTNLNVSSTRTAYETTDSSIVDETFSVSFGPMNNETTGSPLAGKEIVSNISAEIADQNVTVPQLQTTTEGFATLSVSHSARQTTYNITIETNNSTISTPQSNLSRTSTDQGLVDGISSMIGNLSNVSSGTIYNETTDSPLAEKAFVSNISSAITDENMTVPQVQSTTERMATSTVSHSEGKTTQLIITETISSVFGTSKSNLPITSTDQVLVDGISSANEKFKVSSGPLYTETSESELKISVTDLSLAGKEIVSNISAEITDQNVTVPQVQTTTTSMAASTISHSSRQTTQITTTETIKSVFGTSQTSTDQGLLDGISSADANFNASSGTSYETTYSPIVDQTFNISSGPNNNDMTGSSLAGKGIVSNISVEIADQNVTVPQLQTTTMATPSVSHSKRQTSDISATETNNSTMGTPQSNSPRTSTDQGLLDGISSASVIEETSLSGLTESGSQQPSTVASVNELNAMAITTVEIINFTTEPQRLVSESVSDGHPFSNNSNSNTLNTSIDIFNNEDVTLPISNNTALLSKGATHAHVKGVTTENPNNSDTSNVTILSVVSDSVNVLTLASESIITNKLWEMTTVATNTIDRVNRTETVLANVTPNTMNVTETITDANLTGNFANTTENSLYNETVNGNVTETTMYILTSTNNYQKETESGIQSVESRDNGTSPASWNTSDNLANTNGVTFDTVAMTGTINSTDASNVTFPILSPVENSTVSISANESAGNDTLVSNTNTGSGDVRIESILSDSNVTSTSKSNITESEPLI